MTRGFRNNNPGNIRKDGCRWIGEKTGTDPSFKTFETMAWGVRAMFHLINNYNVLHNCCTIAQIIKRWAPDNENNTSAYIASVSKWSGIPSDRKISTVCREDMIPVISAMIRVENGESLPEEQVVGGWDLFLKNKKS